MMDDKQQDPQSRPAGAGPVQRNVKPDAKARQRFEAYFADSRRGKGPSKRPTFAQLGDGTYADDHTQRHWWTWQQAQAAGHEAWIAMAGQVYADAHAIFNDPPSETPQVVRDVIEWRLWCLRA